MKTISTFALLLALVAAGFAIASMLQKASNDKATADAGMHDSAVASAKATAANANDDLREGTPRLNLFHYVTWGAGGVAVFLGLISLARRHKMAGMLAMLIGAAAVGVTFISV